MNPIISLTTIPRRMNEAVVNAIRSLQRQKNCPTIVLNIPHSYRKWGECRIPAAIQTLPGVTIHRPKEDYGPATKLLGALEYVRDHPDITHVMTFDDDVVIANRNHVDHLRASAAILAGSAITVGGIRLEKPPYTRGNGLKYRNKFTWVDIPAGWKGVVYPVQPLLQTDDIFTLRHELPAGIFNDDDAYFGIVLGRLGIPLYAVPRLLRAKLRASAGAGGSAVTEGVGVDREANEATLLSTAVESGLLIPAAKRPASALDPRTRIRLGLAYLRCCLP